MIRRGDFRNINGVWIVECGECDYLERVKDTANVNAGAAAQGWKYTRQSGWVCPFCKRQPRLRYDEHGRVRKARR